jgi:hypothetical protein
MSKHIAGGVASTGYLGGVGTGSLHRIAAAVCLFAGAAAVAAAYSASSMSLLLSCCLEHTYPYQPNRTLSDCTQVMGWVSETAAALLLLFQTSNEGAAAAAATAAPLTPLPWLSLPQLLHI